MGMFSFFDRKYKSSDIIINARKRAAQSVEVVMQHAHDPISALKEMRSTVEKELDTLMQSRPRKNHFVIGAYETLLAIDAKLLELE